MDSSARRVHQVQARSRSGFCPRRPVESVSGLVRRNSAAALWSAEVARRRNQTKQSPQQADATSSGATMELAARGICRWSALVAAAPTVKPGDLEVLSAPRNALRALDGIGVYHALTYLDLYGNGLRSIAGLAATPHLRVLLIGRNSVLSLAELRGVVAGLEVLDAHSNEIAAVSPEDVAHLKLLRVLYLSGNRLTSLGGIACLGALEDLCLSHNAIVQLHGIERCANLRRLTVSHNGLLPSVEGKWG